MRVAITGAASGMGAEACAILKQRNAEVVAFDIEEPAGNVDSFHPVDLSDEQAIASVTGEIEGPFDALLNIAGIPPLPGNEVAVLAVNFIGLRSFTLAMLDRLAPGASIVNMASRAGRDWRKNIDQVKALLALSEDVGLEEFCRHHEIDHVRAYCLSKEAVIVWTIAQTESLIARDIRMNTVSPAGVDTRIFDDFRRAFGEERVDQTTRRAGRPGKPKEAAEIAVFLASPESYWIKGTDVHTDGGATAMMTSDMLKLEEFSSPI